MQGCQEKLSLMCLNLQHFSSRGVQLAVRSYENLFPDHSPHSLITENSDE